MKTTSDRSHFLFVIVNSFENSMIFVTILNPDLKVSLVSYVTILDERRIKVGKEIEVGLEF